MRLSLRIGVLRGRRAVAVAVLVAVVAAATVAAQDSPAIPEGLAMKPLRESLCWSCHGDNKWVPPMMDPFISIQPPASAGAAVGTEFDWNVAFQMTWNPKPAVPHLLFVDPILDITDAPSLRFGGSPPDINGYKELRSIALKATDRPDQPQGNVSLIEVAPGATSLTWTVQPNDASGTGPDLALTFATPGARNVTLKDDNGPGQPETITFGPAELAQISAGNWSVGALVTPVKTNGQAPLVNRVDFSVIEDAKFDTASLKTLSSARLASVPGGGVVLQKWVLKFVQPPAAGEHVRIQFDSVAWYEHNPPVLGGDFGGMTHETAVNATTSGGQPALTYEGATTAIRPLPVNGATLTTVSEAVGYASAFLFITSIVSGGMFGQASRRGLNSIFQSAKRRVAYHNFLSYGLSVAALVHMGIFLFRFTEQYQWTLGIIWGGVAILAMFGLGVTGAFQVPMIRRWSYPTWKWWHYGLTVAAILFTIVHMLLDGAHFPEVQEELGWKDPLYDPTPTV